MRVTNGMLIQNMIRNINGNLSRLGKLQQQASTGNTIQYASDNPVAATRIVKMRSYLAEVSQLQKNADDAKSWMDYSESILKNMGENLKRIRDLTVEASNGTYSGDDLEKIKSEITELKKGFIEMANSSYSGRYVFAGYNTDKAPMESVTTAVGEMVLYKGKYLSLGGVVSSNVSDADLQSFYLSNMDSINGQPELISAKTGTFTAASPSLDFQVVLDGVSQTISLTDGTTYDASALQAELQAKLSAAFPAGSGQPDPLIKVSEEDGRLKFTVQDGSSIQFNSGSLEVSMLGLTDGRKSIRGETEEILYKLGTANRIRINAECDEIFGKDGNNLFDTLQKLELALGGETSYKTASYDGGPPAAVTVETHDLSVSSVLDDLDRDINSLLKSRSEIGARTNYVELTQNRLDDNYITFTKLLSQNEDADYAEVSLKLSSAETVYSASLSAGAKVIQHSLLDFLN